MEIDFNTGQILDAMDEAGIRDNTIVVWFSDNGPTRYSPEADHNGDPGPWSGELGSAWEGGLRTAGMMRWPGKIREGWVSDEIFHVMDLYTTLGRIGGGDIPTDRPVDGLDQTAYLLGEQMSPLCHTSVSRWTLTAGVDVKSADKIERCAKVAGEVVYTVTTALNEYFAGNWTPPKWQPSEEIKHCIMCHSPDTMGQTLDGMNNQQGHMECLMCHDDHMKAGA